MQTIYLDISNKGVLPTIYAKQGDVGRKFLAFITDNGAIVSGLESPVFSVWYEGASGSGNYSAIDDRPAVVFDGKKAEIEMIAQMLVNEGKGQMTIVLNDALGKQIGLWNIEYCVEPVAGQGSEEAKGYFTALSETAARAIAAAEMAENAAAGFYIDNTLTQEGASADAKATGEKIELLQDALDSKVSTETTRVESVEEITKNGYYSLFVNLMGVEDVVAFNAVATDENNIQLSSNILRRKKTNGNWLEWEWVKPPLLYNKEYRTTERFEGLPVYVKAIYFGNLPNNTTKQVQYAANGEFATNILNVRGVATNESGQPQPLPLAYNGGIIELHANLQYVFIRTIDDKSAWTAVVVVKYTKD